MELVCTSTTAAHASVAKHQHWRSASSAEAVEWSWTRKLKTSAHIFPRSDADDVNAFASEQHQLSRVREVRLVARPFTGERLVEQTATTSVTVISHTTHTGYLQFHSATLQLQNEALFDCRFRSYRAPVNLIMTAVKLHHSDILTLK